METASEYSDKQFRLLAEALPQIVWICRPDGKNIYFNQQWVEYTGLTLEESAGDGWNKPFHPDDQKRAWDAWQIAVTSHGTYSLECRLRRKDGEYRWWLIRGIPQLDKEGRIEQWFGTCTNIEDIKQNEAALLESEARYHNCVEHASDGIFIADSQGRYIEVNCAWCNMLGYSRAEILTLSFVDILEPSEIPKFRMQFACLTEGVLVVSEWKFLRKDGSTFFGEIRGSQLPDGHFQGILINITLRKQTEAALYEQQELFEIMGDMTHIGGWAFDPNTGQGTWTKECTKIHDLPEDSPINVAAGIGYYCEEYRQIITDAVRDVCESAKPYDLEVEILSAQGRRKWVRTIGVAVLERGKVVKVYGAMQDITERKLMEAEVIQSRDKAQAIFESISDPVFIMDWGGHFVEVNRAACEQLGYSRDELLQIGLIGIDTPEAAAKIEERVRQIREEDRIVFETAHVRKNGEVVPVELNSRIVNIADKPVILSVARDITDRKRAEEQIAAYIKQLENSMHGTLRAVSNMVEFRDPYTAGHERRVGIISSNIAHEMGWPQEKCNNLELIGLVHDIGKIAIPVEILSKPSRLTSLEYEMVKGHAEKGYEILKDVEFPLPIAKIIRQHHERMDGSGYPLGLKGSEILPEARIIAVADVLESMASHRPYRPALGVEVALKEIIDHKGIWFDTQVVDAVLRMIREKGYQLPV